MRTTIRTDVGGKIGWVEDKDGVGGVLKLGDKVAIIGLTAFYFRKVTIGIVGRLGDFGIEAVFGKGFQAGGVLATEKKVGREGNTV